MASLVSELFKKYNNNVVEVSGHPQILQIHPDGSSFRFVGQDTGYCCVSELSFRNYVYDSIVFRNNSLIRRVYVQIKLAPRSTPKGITHESYSFRLMKDFIQKPNSKQDWSSNIVFGERDTDVPIQRITNVHLNLYDSFAIHQQVAFQRSQDHADKDVNWRFYWDCYYLATYLGTYNFYSREWVRKTRFLMLAYQSDTLSRVFRDRDICLN